MNATLANRLWPQTQAQSFFTVRNLALAILGTLVIAAAAQINVPVKPVPMTLQTLAVIGVGTAYGARLGAATLLLYLIEGCVGLPVFAEFNHLIRADGQVVFSIGYLLGFIPAAGLVGWLAEKGWDKNYGLMFAAALLGMIVLYVPGVLWLGHLFGTDKALPFGFTPFWVGDFLKALVAAFGIPASWRWLNRKV